MIEFSRNKQRILSVVLTCITCWTFAYLAIDVFRNYAFGLFIWLPTVLGACSTLLFAYKNSVERIALRNNAYLTLLIFCIGLLMFAWEGVICLIMAAPIGFVFTYFGFLIGLYLSKNRLSRQTPAAIVLLMLSMPALLSFENNIKQEDNLRSVTTTIEINATPEKVWKKVVSFPQLNAPTEFIFKTGIAYPINATINGKGVGAIRYCNFSTGSFVEPITT